MGLSRLFSLLAYLTTVSYACLNPGEDAPTYYDGAFTVPSGNTPTYSAGTKMNISWTTDFNSSTLWLITGCNFAAPTKSIVVGSSQTWTEWEVDTTSTNSSEIYLFRVVNALGSTSDQQSGGFLSAGFYIAGGPTSSSSSSTKTTSTKTSGSTSTSLALASPTSATGTGVAASSTSSINTATASPQASSAELSTGAKAGIGVGISVGVIGVAALIAAVLLRRRSNKHQSVPNPALQGALQQQEWKDSQQQQQQQHPYGAGGGYSTTPHSSTYDGQFSEVHGTPVPYQDNHVSELPGRHQHQPQYQQQQHQGPVYEM